MRVQDSYSEFPVRAVIVMGVSGCGKSTIGRHLAHLLGDAPFIDADALHSAENIRLMESGQPLSDSNRWPWLKRVREEIENASSKLLEGHDSSLRGARRIIGPSSPSSLGGRGEMLYVVCACSALKRSYREFLSRGDPENAKADLLTHDTVFAFVDVAKAELERRLKLRKNHFFDGRLLDSQLETLDPPDVTREAAVVVYGEGSEEQVAADAYRQVCNYVTKNSL
ncbi:hypothetical protein GGI15_001169 [Coemansia interrupta]|uniref:gluconokinase n=1 Tax=Coemansia interrupta TaxID=1126814 RepID=A0A9W8HPT3_9FUNG|nr:hypothetical protein GGI15_001169 [Coemansia interrupta]